MHKTYWKLHNILELLRLSNSCVNIVIYARLHKDFNICRKKKKSDNQEKNEVATNKEHAIKPVQQENDVEETGSRAIEMKPENSPIKSNYNKDLGSETDETIYDR